jgi:hypothetical protein
MAHALLQLEPMFSFQILNLLRLQHPHYRPARLHAFRTR